MGVPARIGPLLGIKWCVSTHGLGAQPCDHLGQHMVILNAQMAVPDDLQRHMPIADMPGDAGSLVRIVCDNIANILLSGNDAHIAIRDGKTIAIGQILRLSQIEQQCAAHIIAELNATAVPIVVAERDGRDLPIDRPPPSRCDGFGPADLIGHRQNRK